jgi:hypothetical protein
MSQIKPRRPITFTISLVCILLNALVWLGLGAIIALNAHPAIPDLPYIKPFMIIASFGIAVVLFGLFFFLYKLNRWAFIPALTVLGASVLLNIFDQLGWSDLIVIALNLIPFILLIKDRAWYLSVQSNAASAPPTDQDASST